VVVAINGVGVLVCWVPGYTPLPIRGDYDVNHDRRAGMVTNHGQKWIEGDHQQQQKRLLFHNLTRDSAGAAPN